MCLLLISFKNHPVYKIIVAANRDEFYNRPASAASFWNEHPALLAGRDLQAGGTWLGITKSGKFSAITNYRDASAMKNDAPSRGKLVSGFLINPISPFEYSEQLKKTGGMYNGFNLLFSDNSVLYYYSNQTGKALSLSTGIYGLSNHLLDTPWPKVEKSKKSFSQILKNKNISAPDLFGILSDSSVPPDELLPDTGVGLEIERAVSPVFVSTPMYGTRSSTVILIDYEGNVIFIEKTLDKTSGNWSKKEFEFAVEKPLP